MEASPPNPQDLSLSCHPSSQNTGARSLRPGLVWPLSQRSGRIPALPYPLLRPAPVCQNQIEKKGGLNHVSKRRLQLR